VKRKGAWEAGWGRERVALIKSLIMRDRKDALEVRLPNRAVSADKWENFSLKISNLGPLHTRYFYTQYCDKRWKDIDNFETQWLTKVSS